MAHGVFTPGAATEPGADLTTGAATEEASQAGEAKGVDGASIGERVDDVFGVDDSSTGSEWEDIGKRRDMQPFSRHYCDSRAPASCRNMPRN